MGSVFWCLNIQTLSEESRERCFQSYISTSSAGQSYRPRIPRSFLLSAEAVSQLVIAVQWRKLLPLMNIEIVPWTEIYTNLLQDNYHAYIDTLYHSYDLFVGGPDLSVDILYVHRH